MITEISKEERLVKNLKDAGCDDKTIEKCLKLMSCRCKGAVTGELSRYRAQLLSSVHQEQEKLDCLDFLLYKLKSEEEK